MLTGAVRIVFLNVNSAALEQYYHFFDMYAVTSNVMFLWRGCISCNGRALSRQRAVEDITTGPVHIIFPSSIVTALEQNHHIVAIY